MGCVASKEIDINDPLYRARQADRAITEALNQNSRDKKATKILLLGAGESGKSTVLKQLKILHKDGFSTEERTRYTNVIWSDAINSICVLIIEARKRKISLDCQSLDLPLKGYSDVLFAYRNFILSDIDTKAAGGEQFLNDYHSKYGTANQYKRDMMSTGKVEGFDEYWDYDESDSLFDDSFDDNNEKLQISENQTSNNQKLNANITGFVGKNKNMIRAKQISKYEVAEAILEIWTKDKGVKESWLRRNEFQIESNADYYFENIMKFAEDHYLSTNEDILKARIRTTGIQESRFRIKGSDVVVLDAGGQRSERRKWLKSFKDVTTVIFVLAISEYDQELFEDRRVNRVHESLMLLQTLVNYKDFKNTPFMIFLNKTDLFREKVKRSPMKKYLPTYDGKPFDYQDGINYFRKLIFSLKRNGNQSIYLYETTATDTTLMKKMIATMADIFLQDNLRATGMM